MNWRWIGNFVLLGALLAVVGLVIGLVAVTLLARLFPGVDVRIVLLLIFLGMGSILTSWAWRRRP